MSGNSECGDRGWFSRGLFGLVLLLAAAGITAAVLILPLTGETNTNQLSLGDVADQDILAPYALSFQSDVLTEIRQEEAASSVLPQYTQPDPNIAREQLNHLRDVMDYIASVRADSFASPEQKKSDLQAIQAINLDESNIDILLELSDNEWQTVRLEANRILEQVMRSAIQENQLDAVRLGISNQVSLSLSTNQQAVVVDLVSDLITPNSFFSETLTEERR